MADEIWLLYLLILKANNFLFEPFADFYFTQRSRAVKDCFSNRRKAALVLDRISGKLSYTYKAKGKEQLLT